nr:MAG: capsid protein [Virus sp.]
MAYRRSRGYKKSFGRKRRHVVRAARRVAPRRRLVPMPGRDYGSTYRTGTKPPFQFTLAPTSAPKVGNLRGAPLRGRVPNGDVTRLGENTTMSSCYLGASKGNMRRLFSATGNGALKKLYNNTVGQFNGATGTQSQIGWNVLGRADLVGIKTNLEADLPTEMKPGANDMKIWFGRVVQRLHMKNQTNHVACVVLYDIIPSFSSVSTAVDTPAEAWVKGVTDQGFASYATYPGNSPYESKEFKKYFKVVKTTRLYLEPGEQHEHVFTRSINKVFSSSLFDNTNANAGEAVYGMSGYIMASAYGSIGHSATDAAASVSYMPVRIDWIHHTTVQCQYSGVALKKTAVGTNNITTVAPANWDFIAAVDDVEGDLINA